MNKLETRTISLKLIEPPAEFGKTLHHYLNALNYTSQYVHKHKVTNTLKVQSLLYKKLRKKFGLKSQMACNCFRQVSGAYKTAKKNGYKYKEPISFKRESLILDYPRDWKFKDEGTLSLNTLEGRKPVAFVCGKHQRAYLDEAHAGAGGGWRMKSGRLLRRKNGDWYFNIAMTKEFEVGGLEDRATVIGVDLGINNIAVAYTTDGSVRFFKGGEIKNKKRQFESVRGHLQAKGTRSAKRILVGLSGRERRFMADINHQISKELVRFASGFPNPLIALEDLTGIKKRLGQKPRKGPGGGLQKPTNSRAGRKAIGKWSYHQLRLFIEYKAAQAGIPVVYVAPAYTSQTCPRCGHTERANRNGRSFLCRACSYGNNADVVGAKNVLTRATSIRYTLEEAGRVSTGPEVTPVDGEAPIRRGTEPEGSHKPRPSGRGS